MHYGRALRLLACALMTFTSTAFPQSAPPKTSAEVTVRGMKDLKSAVRLAVGAPVAKGEKLPTVLFVVEAGVDTAKAEPKFVEAFRELDKTFPAGTARFRLAALGDAPGPPAATATALLANLSKIFKSAATANVAGAAESPVETPDLIAALRKAVSATDGPGRVVFIADRRFEEDTGVEGLIETLLRRNLRFTAIAPEAGFGRAWGDAYLVPKLRRGVPSLLYSDRVGLSPFGPSDQSPPWRGGDTAWPHLPGHWRTLSGLNWPFNDDYELRPSKSPLVYGRAPLPSSFGSYSLSRVAAATGGRYVIFGWTTSPAAGPAYDDVRCDRYAPDLRSRADIFADVARRPLARALVDVWATVAGDEAALVGVRPPVDRGNPERMKPTPYGGNVLAACFQERSDRDQFVDRVRKVSRTLLEKEKLLAEAMAASPPDRDAVDRRYYADADLLRYILLLTRFSIGEAALTAEESIPTDAWDGRAYPGLVASLLVPASDLGHRLIASLPGDVRDPVLFETLKAERSAFIERYRGTPFAETVERHFIATAAVAVCGTGEPYRPPPGGRNGSKSDKGKTDGGKPPPRPAAPGSTGGGGGTTGGSGGSGGGG